ncbi:MAG: rhodanese-like domain-containing protein [Bacteroidetes bacterium]|jgi:rhodanese-related sulfurtransferase|nr:rhodanese-like domain-containing protein [Bacteroidota bacterium]MBK6839413.1 rhodanese-like domain-containing protein [Bacteroidota bacterium]MBK9526555.1 rhodanese-like domain-containing protein [Bacteroidota bacterium]MBK9542643.1 rhodanese-like domain-containing protein [Bacteroidota bacterium]MBP6401554.1 rhodanese-like domain-containing protein [Bacteroidia bacterium]
MTEKFIQALKTGEATVVDVRTPMEFMGGHATGSINIPLYEIEERIEELRKMKNLVLCCASGNRSGMVAEFLQSIDIPCYNAGSWLDVNYLQVA